MAISRKHALNRMDSLRLRIEDHFTKLATEPESRAVGHWIREITVWIEEIERLSLHVGKQTETAWSALIAQWRAVLPRE